MYLVAISVTNNNPHYLEFTLDECLELLTYAINNQVRFNYIAIYYVIGEIDDPFKGTSIININLKNGLICI